MNLDKENKNVIVTVSDNGIGIDPKNLSRIFDANWSNKSKTGNKPEHSGLGLSIAKHLVENSFGGKIEVKSQTTHHEHGTKFKVTLPKVIY
jgi:signal transduction histidine kinase